MKIWSLVLLIVLSFSVALDKTAIAKEKKASNKQKIKSESAEVATSPVVPFDISAEKLPSDYKGINITKLYSMIAKKLPPERGEFETAEEYAKRIQSSKPIVTDNIYAFKLDEKPLSVIISPYYVDANKFKIKIHATPLGNHPSTNPHDNRAILILKSIPIKSGSYIGSNLFGAKVIVEKNEDIEYGIALVNQSKFGVGSFVESIRDLDIELYLPPREAKAIKNKIGILVLCKLKPYEDKLIFEDYYFSGKPTIDSPYEDKSLIKYINAEIIGVWLYNIQTGEIVLRKQLNDK